ncbi:very-long-chain (3R)-3-hydroxyacyl-[acyl-carrierprotein] dehydratase PASTICCINO 2 [Striga asiatica]|uniref:Very-long-chain (3R)-3-hydroxyacyl-[acyl-carrierprotein] dehydratase PASTICCINO 2 n=1 Tax=Striga asiatica TaxID=4170 RepID=A0A5A7Q236_STRAF|nr:very-long-chain (3R)-3-hydroxyacyl-[acyl-carrierprotein] dehydratase PASTICCINO 2 [Striga asiatica]
MPLSPPATALNTLPSKTPPPRPICRAPRDPPQPDRNRQISGRRHPSPIKRPGLSRVGILYSFPEIRTHFLVGSLVISWLIAEIICYSFFGVKEAFGHAPSGCYG